MSTLISAILSPEFRSLVSETAVSSTERAVSKSVLASILDRLPKTKIEKYSTVIGMGMLLEAFDTEGKAVPHVLSRTVMRGAIAGLLDEAKELFSPYELEQLMQEGGSLYNITDEAAILRTVADYYAEVAARERENYYRFNMQGNEANVMTININVLNEDTGKKEKEDIQVFSRADEPVLCKALGDTFPPQPEGWAMLDRPMSWPLTRYCDAKDVNPTILHNKRRGRINNRPVVIDRYELHTRLTNVLDQMIPPSLMVVDINGTPYTGSVYQGNYKVEHDGYSGPVCNSPRYNSQAAAGATMTVPEGAVATDTKTEALTTDTKTEEPKVETKAEETKAEPAMPSFPITKDQCMLAPGNYKCFRCGKTGLKKNGLGTYGMPKIPDGTNKDLFEESIKWAQSSICGACREELKNNHEAVVKKYTDYNKAVDEWVNNDKEVENAKRALAELEESRKTLDNNPTAAKLVDEQITKARFNVQSCEAKAIELEDKVNMLDPNGKLDTEPKAKVEEPKAEEVKAEESEVQESATENAKTMTTNTTTMNRKQSRKAKKAAARRAK